MDSLCIQNFDIPHVQFIHQYVMILSSLKPSKQKKNLAVHMYMQG